MTYAEFLQSKQIKTAEAGFDASDDNINAALFDWQKVIVKWALKKGRAAIFADCGLGKTAMQLEWGQKVYQHTGGNVLIVAPLAVSKQTIREGQKFGYKVTSCRTQAEVRSGLNITNYEMLSHFDANAFEGVILDESSILKSYMGTIKRQIIATFADTPYKLACTATPSPNNHMEILNQAEFLGVMKSHEALAIWFINDTSQSGHYMLKGHAVKPFWEWVSTWAVCMTKPSDIGFSDAGYELPPLNEVLEIVAVNELSDNIDEGLFRTIETNATAFHREKRITADDRARRCADIVNSTDEQYLIWCGTDYEADKLTAAIPDAVEVRGSMPSEKKERAALDFIDGNIRVLISKARIFGYGLNFQNCRNTIFCGMDFSYENYYQAIRRFWRFGQQRTVNAYIVIGSTEAQILRSVQEKEKRQKEMKRAMYGSLKNIQNANMRGTHFTLNIDAPIIRIPQWLKSEVS